jgi:hypothetical protein
MVRLLILYAATPVGAACMIGDLSEPALLATGPKE